MTEGHKVYSNSFMQNVTIEDLTPMPFSRNWRVLYNEIKRTFTLMEYKKYLADIRRLAMQLECDVQEVDYLLWKEYVKLGEQINQGDGE